MAQITVKKGRVVPDTATIRKVAKFLATELKTDKKLAAQFKRDPRGVLGGRGLPFDVQTELLSDFGRPARISICEITCICSGCCVTSINISA